MKDRLLAYVIKHRYYFILVAIFLLAEVITWPAGEFPLNDDWTYCSSAFELSKNGKVQIGFWPAMTLWTHLMWGALFTKIFGSSYFVLRLSIIVASLAGLVAFLRLLDLRSGDKKVALLGAAVMLFNPVYFNLTNSYMTDVNFCVFLMGGFYFAFRYFETGSWKHFAGVLIMSILLVLIRQFGLVLPLSLTAGAIFSRQQRWIKVIAGILVFVITVGVLKLYESFLKETLPPYSAYRFMGSVNYSSKEFWDKVKYFASIRWDQIILQMLMFSGILAFALLPRLIRQMTAWITVPVLILSAVLSWYYFQRTDPVFGNILNNFHLGAETFYQDLRGDGPLDTDHTKVQWFSDLIYWTKLMLATVSLSTLVLGIIRTPIAEWFSSSVVMMICWIVVYSFLIIITDSYFDRYHLPLIFVFMLLIAGIRTSGATVTPAYVLLLAPAFFSIAGTRDYFKIQTMTWKIFSDLTVKEKIDEKKINPGFEVAFTRGKLGYDVLTIKPFDYVVQFDEQPKFARYRPYPFYRELSFSHDTIWVYKRISPPDS